MTLRSLFFVIKRQTTLREIAFALRSPAVQGLLVAAGMGLLLLALTENGRLRTALAILVGIVAGALIPVIFALRTGQSIYGHVRPLGSRLRVVACHLLGRTESGLYRWSNAVRWYTRVLNTSAVPRDSDLLGIVLCDLGGAFTFGGRRQETLAAYDRALAVYAQHGAVFDLGRARILIGRMNAFVYFGDYAGTFNQGAGKAELDFLDGMRFCSPEDPVVRQRDEAYQSEFDATRLQATDPYGASKAHCQYSWGLLEENPGRALWHARLALDYAGLVEDSLFSPMWGLRDGAVGSYWREAVSLFTIADCHTLLGEMAHAEAYYTRSHLRIPYQERRWYFMGHYWWLYLCKCGRVGEAREWLEEVLRVANQDDYRWRAALAHSHYGDLERFFGDAKHRESAQRHYEAALGVARGCGLGSLAAGAERRIAGLGQDY